MILALVILGIIALATDADPPGLFAARRATAELR
jgi:hypothetical protein